MSINTARSKYNTRTLADIVMKEKPDVLLLQEVNPVHIENDALKSIVSVSSNRGISWHTSRIADVAILSRRPLTHLQSYSFIPGSGRRVLVGQTEAGGREISIACVHFSTNMPGTLHSGLSKHLEGSTKSRMIQANAVATALPVRATVIGGR